MRRAHWLAILASLGVLAIVAVAAAWLTLRASLPIIDGPAALAGLDAAVTIERADANSRALLEAYTAGVNAGLGSLRSRPFEYWVLGSRPEPWRPEDTILCVHAMFLQLQDSSGHGQLQRGLLKSALPESLWRFLEAD